MIFEFYLIIFHLISLINKTLEYDEKYFSFNVIKKNILNSMEKYIENINCITINVLIR